MLQYRNIDIGDIRITDNRKWIAQEEQDNI